MMYRVLDRIDHSANLTIAPCSMCSANVASGSGSVAPETAPLNLRPPLTGQAWPKSLTTLKGKCLSAFLVQFFMEGLGSLPKSSGLEQHPTDSRYFT